MSFGLNGAFLVWLSAPMPTVALWLPWILIAIDRTLEHGRPRDGALLALAVGGMLLGAYLPTSLVVLATCGTYGAVRSAIGDWRSVSHGDRAGWWGPPGGAQAEARALPETDGAGTAAQPASAWRRSPVGPTRALRTAGLLLAGTLVGLVLASVGLVPMLATLRDSPAAGRSVFGSTLPWQNLATFALPDFWGTPLAQTWWYPGTGNYPEFVTYLGIVTIALAGAGLVAALAMRDAASLTLAAVGLVGLGAMYGLAPATWLGIVPGFRQMNPYRWNVALACAMSVLAAGGLDALRGLGRRDRRDAQAEARALPPSGVAPTAPAQDAQAEARALSPDGAPTARPADASALDASALDARALDARAGKWDVHPFWALAGVLATLALLATISGLVVRLHLDDIRRLSLQPFERAQILRFALIAGAALVLSAATAWMAATRRGTAQSSRPSASQAPALLLVALVAADLIAFGHGFNPTLSRDRYYPATPGLERTRALAEGGRVAPVAPPAQFVHGHVWSMFGLEVVSGFDFFGDVAYQRFLDRAADREPLLARWDFVGLERANARLLGLLNVTTIVTPPECAATHGAGYSTVGELTDGRRLTQEFAAEVEGLRGIDVLTAAYGRVNQGTLTLTLRAPGPTPIGDGADSHGPGEIVATRGVDAADVPENGWLRLEFAPQPRRVGVYRLDIEARGAPPGRAATLWATAAPVEHGATLTIDGARDPRAIWYRAFAADPARVPGATLLWSGDLNIYRNDAALPRAWFASTVDVLPAERHLDELARPSFDLRSRAVLAGPLPGATPSTTARVTSVGTPVTDQRLITVEAPDGGVLVVSERFANGWTAEVDGRRTSLVRANAVLLALAVPAGAHTVVLTFASPTFWPSLALSAVALAGITLALFGRARTRPSGRQRKEGASRLTESAASQRARGGSSDDDSDHPDHDREISTGVVGRVPDSDRPDGRLDR
jgi:hypothetical protein